MNLLLNSADRAVQLARESHGHPAVEMSTNAVAAAAMPRDVAVDTYNRLSGEVEARATEARRGLGPEQRRARPPWLDYDVPEPRQVVPHPRTR